MPPRGLLIIGCGYSGTAIARLACADGIPVWGTSRTEQRFEAIAAAGAIPLLYAAGDPLPPDVLESVDVVVDSVGPPWSGDPDPTEAILDALAPIQLSRFAYLSSTSVYGDHSGEWVDEDTPVSPVSPAGKRRLAAETLLLDRRRAGMLPAVICRLPGIYGPGRSVLDRLRGGRFRWVEGRVPYSNRIHVEDLARGVWAACTHDSPAPHYLICDGQPGRLDEMGRYAAELLGIPFPEALASDVADATIGANAIAMLTHSKRLRNHRMREHLGVEPLYPSYREGLKAVIDAEYARNSA